MYKSYSMELAGRTLTVDIGRVAAQANGAVFIKYGDTTVLSTATASDKNRLSFRQRNGRTGGFSFVAEPRAGRRAKRLFSFFF